MLGLGVKPGDLRTIGDLELVRLAIVCAPKTSAYARAKLGPAVAEWGIVEELLASQLDASEFYRWVDSGKKGSKPKPIVRPSAKPKGKVYGAGEGMSLAEFKAWWADQEGRSG